MYHEYAADPRMRLNLGIRRRLGAAAGQRPAQDRAAARACSSRLPGSPILYYGDEIGMGDNIYLGDRNGVRTPMQWTGDRNAGFSPRRRRAPLPARHRRPGLRLPGHQRRGPAPHPDLAAELDEAASSRCGSRPACSAAARSASCARRTTACSPTCASTRARPCSPCTTSSGVGPAGGARPPRVGRAHPGRDARRQPLPRHRGRGPYFLSLAPYGYYWFRLQPPAPTEERYGLERNAL